jgi:hypothetical protein
VEVAAAHRGRLNLLVNLLGKPLGAVCTEMEGKQSDFRVGDVKYHLGEQQLQDEQHQCPTCFMSGVLSQSQKQPNHGQQFAGTQKLMGNNKSDIEPHWLQHSGVEVQAIYLAALRTGNMKMPGRCSACRRCSAVTIGVVCRSVWCGACGPAADASADLHCPQPLTS